MIHFIFIIRFLFNIRNMMQMNIKKNNITKITIVMDGALDLDKFFF